MISEIIYALKQELKYFSKENDCMVIFDTELKEDMTFSLPLIIIDYGDSQDSARLPGNGLTRLDYILSVRVYMQEPDAYIDDDTTGSTSYLNFSDTVRNFLENEKWITQLMVNVAANYGLRLTYIGTGKAPGLQTEDKMLKGFIHTFDTISFDNTIQSTVDITETAQTVSGEVDFA